LPDALPPTEAAALVLPASVQVVEFISDLHLSPELPRTVAAFERYLRTTAADAIFILGDLFEVWVGDDAMQQPFEAACVQAIRICAQTRPVHVMRGNRDFLLGPAFFAATGATELPDPQPVCAFGQTALLSHGDALCLDDVEYMRFRSLVRSPAWKQDFLAKPLAERLKLAAQMRRASREHQGGRDPVTYADADPSLADKWLRAAGAHTLVHGHTHRPRSEAFAGQADRHVLSDWDLDHAQPGRAEMLRWTSDGFTRHALAG
jgi:UDP-2,3-diacylglucosamine hydrolase